MKTDNTIHIIGRINDKANKFLLRELAQIGFTDIAPSHGDILVTLFKHKELPMTEIANRIHRDRSTVTTLVNKLIKLGYVSSKKDPQDSRSSLVFLTEKGKSFEPYFSEISQSLYATEYKGISEEEKRIFQNVLKKINKNFKSSLNKIFGD